jgi:hypothetical protein
MTTAIKPIRVEVDCVFRCPDCGCEKWYTVHELQYRTLLECVCGHKTPIIQVKSIDISFGCTVKSIPSLVQYTGLANKEEPNTKAFNSNMFISTMVTLGYNKTSACQKIKECENLYNGNDEDFLTLLLRT